MFLLLRKRSSSSSTLVTRVKQWTKEQIVIFPSYCLQMCFRLLMYSYEIVNVGLKELSYMIKIV